MRTGERVLERDFADDRWSLALVVRTTGVRLFSSGVDRLLPLSSSEGVSYSESLDKLFCEKDEGVQAIHLPENSVIKVMKKHLSISNFLTTSTRYVYVHEDISSLYLIQ